MNQGPNVKRLIVCRMSMIAVPKNGYLNDAPTFLLSPFAIEQAAKEATAWVNEAIGAVKAAPDNPYGDDDEAIAGEILRQIEGRKQVRRSGTN